ncbi:hypothetical protein A3D70_01790 [Candidatus Adlerbacteria bacterium RIFCSPHIGHO2_02_FULL_54_18]|uniref:DUF305 domain-containing protein n=2 Tax=Candidatus Adleribacteriota TaxID=1752736 RepID=A0A1F4Y3L3_9BACT|nr:MAG: hypothetical protein A2949_01050 [Candidatus Adlerbacteria bacterium RIFCSPLOWO2_01_FULL_54_21b]OGC88539.1 MAG: hypothetical protein A3D70_01790 [Candidatus Adlerbacteria bacterium RIFCSPHIGHO2_02_FULL_54_18]
MTNTNTLGLLALALVAGIGVGYALWGTQASAPIGTHMMSGGYSMDQNIDQHFIVQMIPHHDGAIAMAKIALERSKRPEMITLANNIIEAQEKEIADMRSWYRSWYGTTLPATIGDGMMGMPMGGMTGSPDTLKSVAAADFDREFINEMIPHHEMAVMMAQMLAAGTGRPEMKQLASDIIASQSSEIETMRGWLKSWYGN